MKLNIIERNQKMISFIITKPFFFLHLKLAIISTLFILILCIRNYQNMFFICRIIMCMLCGDPYSVEYVLGPLLAQQNCYLSGGERSIAIETQLGGDTKRKVEVVLSSYHGATDFR